MVLYAASPTICACRAGSRNTSSRPKQKQCHPGWCAPARGWPRSNDPVGHDGLCRHVFFEEEIARVTKAVGMRGVLGQPSSSFRSPTRRRRERPWRGPRRSSRSSRRTTSSSQRSRRIRPIHRRQGSARVARARRNPACPSDPVAETETELHASQKAHAGMSPVAYLQSIGFWGPAPSSSMVSG